MQARDIPMNRLYGDLAWLWPLLSPPEDYAEEAGHWRDVLREALGPGRHPVLELGVGGGHNLSHLLPAVDAVAVDIAEPMLELSRRLNPTVEHIRGDMRSVRLERRFAAVLIHDAISHITTASDLRAVFATARAHLGPGGLVIAAPDWLRESFDPPWTSEFSHADETRRLTAFEYVYDPDPADTEIECLLTYVIETGGETMIEHDRLALGLFPRAAWRRTIEAAGFRFRERRFRLESAGVEYRLMTGRLPAR